MKHRFQGIIIGFIVAIMLISTFTYAATGQNVVEIFYSNIKIFIDGGEFIAKNANSEIVEPFIMNGTTYLPVRAIATAFGKDVVWDGKTSSIYLGKKDQNQPDNYLDRIQYSYYAEANEANNLWKINGNITDHLKNDYTNGMLFYTYYSSVFSGNYTIEDDKDNSKVLIDYPLNGLYKKLTGKIILPQKLKIAGLEEKNNENNSSQTATLIFYADGEHIYTANSVTTTMPFAFDLDVKGVNTLTVKVITSEDGSFVGTYVALTDLALYK